MFSLRDLRFVFCSLHRDVLRAQRIIGFFILLPTKQRGQKHTVRRSRNRNHKLPCSSHAVQQVTLTLVVVRRPDPQTVAE